MSEKEWYKPTEENISPFDLTYIKEFALPSERTEQEVRSLGLIISAMSRKPRVLDIAGGFGRIGSELVRLNLVSSLVNLDLNRQFLQIARAGNIKRVVWGDMRALPFSDRSFDLALIMFTSFGYFSDEDNFRVLEEAYRVLDYDGILVLDLPNYDRICRNFSSGREKTIENGEVIAYRRRIEGVYLIEERTLKTKAGEEKTLLPIRLRIYSPEEMLELCRKAGFKTVKFVDQNLEEFTQDSKRLWVVGTK